MNMIKLTGKAAISAAAIAATAIIPFAANAAWSPMSYVKQLNGVEWHIRIDEDLHTASIGTNLTSVGIKDSAGTYAPNFAVVPALSGKWILPEEFTIDGVSYQVTMIGNRALMEGADVTSLTFPSGVGHLYNCVAYGRKKLKSLCFKGPATVASGTQPTVTLSTEDGTGQVFAQCNALKTIFVGPNIKASNSVTHTPRFPNSTGYTLFLPRNSGNMTWNSYTALGTNPNVIYYGPNEELEFQLGDTMVTAMVRTTGALTNLLNQVATFKNDFGLDTRISVTNTLDLTGVTIDSTAVSGVTFDRLMFSAKTQAQLNAILGAFPATTPISIDPTGLTENMVIPETYNNVYVKTVPGVTIKRTVSGLMIIVK